MKNFRELSNCTLIQVAGSEEVYAEPSYLFLVFSLVILSSIICGPYGIMLWHFLVGMVFVAFYRSRRGGYLLNCQDENLVLLEQVMNVQLTCTVLFWVGMTMKLTTRVVRQYLNSREGDEVSVTAIQIAI